MTSGTYPWTFVNYHQDCQCFKNRKEKKRTNNFKSNIWMNIEYDK